VLRLGVAHIADAILLENNVGVLTMNALVPSYSTTRSLGGSEKNNISEDSSPVRAVAVVLGLLVRFLGLLLLLGLFVITSLVWIWLASFRSGWRLGDWLDDPENSNQDKLALNILHSSIVAIFSPLAIFGDWSEKLINERFQIQFPPKIDLRQIVEKQLGVKFPDDSPCLPKKINSLSDSTDSGDSK
jgi:hypothetical protein